MAEVTDIAVYRKLVEIADDLEAMAAEGASLVGNAALTTAANNARGMAAAVYKHLMADNRLDS